MSVFYGMPRLLLLPAHAAPLVVADKWRGQSKLFIIVITAGGKQKGAARGGTRHEARGGRQEGVGTGREVGGLYICGVGPDD